jgi:hypothetical protein
MEGCVSLFMKILNSSLFHLINTIRRNTEVCAIKLNITPIQLIILAIYRSPSGNFTNFLKNLDSVLNTWYSNKTVFVICGDININYLKNCKKRRQLDALLQTYNLIGTVSLPMHKTNVSSSAIDNVFITRSKNYTISRHINGLSDHEAQIIVTVLALVQIHKDLNTRFM